MFPWLIKNLGYLYFSAILLSYSYLIWKYYVALPISKKTVLTYLVQDLVMLLLVYKCYEVIKFWLMSSGVLDSALTIYPNFTCSVFSMLPCFLLTLNLVCSISSVKAFARFWPNNYLSLDHEKVRLVVLVSSIVLWITELTIVGFVDGSFCGTGEAFIISSLTDLELDFEQARAVALIVLLKTTLTLITRWLYTREKKQTDLIPYQREYSYKQRVIAAIRGVSHYLWTLQPISHTSSENNTAMNNIDIEMSTVNGRQNNSVTTAQDRCTPGTQIQQERVIDVDGNQPRGNTVVPEGIPQGKTKKAFILQMSGFIISSFGFFIVCAILMLLDIPAKKWIQGVYFVRDLILFSSLIRWVNSSEEILEYAMRKIIQFLQSF